MIKFERRFFKYLNEADETEDRQAMRDMLDKETDISDFDVDMSPDESKNISSAADRMARIQQQSNDEEKQQLLSWIDYLNEVATRLNGLESDSMQSILSNAAPGSVFSNLESDINALGKISESISRVIQSFQTAYNKGGEA